MISANLSSVSNTSPYKVIEAFYGRNTHGGRDQVCRVMLIATAENDPITYSVLKAWCNTGGSLFDVPIEISFSSQEALRVFHAEVSVLQEAGFISVDSFLPFPRLSTRRLGRDAVNDLDANDDWVLVSSNGFPLIIDAGTGTPNFRSRFGARCSPNLTNPMSDYLGQLPPCCFEASYIGNDLILSDIFHVDGQSCHNLPYLERLDYARRLGFDVAAVQCGSSKMKALRSGQMISKGFWLARPLFHKPFAFNEEGDYWIDLTNSLYAIVDDISAEKCTVLILGEAVGDRLTFCLPNPANISLARSDVVRVNYRWLHGKLAIDGPPAPAFGVTWRDCSLLFLKNSKENSLFWESSATPTFLV